MALIDVSDISLRFGGLVALNHVTLKIEPETITALVGPNGAGKTTLFNVISGFLRADAGSIRFRGVEIGRLAPQQVARMGLVRSFQDVRVFGELTVLENIQVAAEAAERSGRSGLPAAHVVDRLGLRDQAQALARDLSYAEQKFISLGRMIASQAPVLLLDEPSSGLDTASLDRLADLIRRLRRTGTTIVMVEHNLDMVRSIAERVAFLHKGELLAHGEAGTILADQRLVEVYLGGGL
jgi:ABC-type branched-subunit amino acid transport system ATPase component